jgi:hypothetical protein
MVLTFARPMIRLKALQPRTRLHHAGRARATRSGSGDRTFDVESVVDTLLAGLATRAIV